MSMEARLGRWWYPNRGHVLVVNQSQSHAAERNAGILWAPERGKAGQRQRYWTAMTDVLAGDLLFHYAEQRIRALSRAVAPAVATERPRRTASCALAHRRMAA